MRRFTNVNYAFLAENVYKGKIERKNAKYWD